MFRSALVLAIILGFNHVVFANSKSMKNYKLLREDVELEHTEHFVSRPLKYLHPQWIPEEVRDKMESRKKSPKVGGGSCEMTIDYLDYEDYYAFMNGIFYGFEENPQGDPSDCPTCVFMGQSAGSIQEGLVGLTVTRSMWRDFAQIISLSFWDQISRLLFVYLMLVSVVFNMDKVWRYETMQLLLDSLIA